MQWWSVARVALAAIIASGFCATLLAASPYVPAPAEVPAPRPAANSRDWERILPVAVDLRADGTAATAARKPILIFFNLSNCPYCRGALREVLVPMFRSAEWRNAIEFRQVTIDDGQTLTGFDGQRIGTREFAQQRKGTFTPTVMMVDGNGQLLGEPIVGVANFDFYAAYVEGLAKTAVDTLKARP